MATENQIKKTILKCPWCKSTKLMCVGPEYLCRVCDWNSAKESVEMGSMDNLFEAYINHFFKNSTEN